MAQYTVYINDEELHEDDVLEIKKSAYDLNFAGDKLISNKTEITLSNFNYKFDTRRGTNGYFEKIEWFNNPVKIVDNREGTTFFEGRLKNLKLNDSRMTLTLEVSDYLQDMTDTICVISELDITPAEAIYKILTNPDYLNIPEDKIIKGAFDFAAILQNERKIKISFTLEDNKNCIDVIEELCKISCYSKVFLVDNKISYWVWQPFFGAQGFPIEEIIPGSYSEEIKFDIINECSIAYQSGGNVARFSNKSEISQAKYGAGKAFLMPDKNVESTSAVDYKILYKTEAGASAVANEILNRMKDVKKVCSFTVSDELSFLELGNDVELKFKPFVREPVRIIGIQPNTKNGTLSITAEFLNYPELFPIDISKPEAPELFSVQSINDGKIIIKWVPHNQEITNYTLYFSKTGSNWEDLLINNARSPIILIPDGLDNGLFYKVLEGFNPGETYYFRMKVIGTNFLLSDFSNTLTLKHRLHEYNFDLYGNGYRTNGDIFFGIKITPDNPLSGTAPDLSTYDSMNYDEGNYSPVYGEYITQVFKSETGFKNFTFFTKFLSRNDSIKIFKRTQNEDDTFNEWEGYYLINGEEVFNTDGAKRIQFRFWFNVPLLSSNDLIYITNYEEI